MDVAKASERLLKLAVSIIQFPRKQGAGVPCRPEVLNQVAHRAIQPYIYIYISIHIDRLFLSLYSQMSFPNHFLSLRKLWKRSSNPSPNEPVSSCSLLSPRATYFPSTRARAKHYRTCVLLPAKGSYQNRSSSEELLSLGPIFANSASFPSFARGRGHIFLPTPLSVSLNTPSLLQIPLPIKRIDTGGTL